MKSLGASLSPGRLSGLTLLAGLTLCWSSLGAMDLPGFTAKAFWSWRPVLIEVDASKECTNMFGLTTEWLGDLADRHHTDYYHLASGPEGALAKDLGLNTIVYLLFEHGKIVKETTIQEINSRAPKSLVNPNAGPGSPNGSFFITPGALDKQFVEFMEQPAPDNDPSVLELNRRLARRSNRAPLKWTAAAGAAALIFF
ncbi:MAG: hypothetical protein ACHQ49_10535 [Elusimicrobiota bacterium]